MFLKNCELVLSCIIAELFNMCLRESFFPRFLEGLISRPCIKEVGERCAAENYCPVSLLSVASKVFEKLVNIELVEHLGKCALFSDFQYGFRSSRSTAYLPIVASDRIASLGLGLGLLRL